MGDRADGQESGVSVISDRNDIYVQPRDSRKRRQVRRIGGEDEIPVGCQQDQRRVDDIVHSSSSQQDAGTPAESSIKRGDVERGQQTREVSLTPGSSSPDLSDDAAVRERWPACEK